MDARPSPPVLVSEVKAARIAFAPGQPTGLHSHRVPVVGLVTRGSFRFHVDGQPEKLLHVGDTFFEPANIPILAFDNASTEQQAEIVAFYLSDGGSASLITLLG